MSDEPVAASAAPPAELPGFALDTVRAEFQSPNIHLILKMPHLAVRGRDVEGTKALETLCHDFFSDALKSIAMVLASGMRLLGSNKEQAIPFLQTYLAAMAQNALRGREAANEILGDKRVLVAQEVPK